MFDPDEAELEEDLMEDASETTSDGEDDDDDDDDDTTISISDPDDDDVNLDRVREASPVFYIDPEEEEEEASSGNEETLTEQKVEEMAPSVVEDVDEDVSLLRSVLCSPLGRMRTVSMMSASPPQSRPPGLKRPNSLVEQPRSLLRGRMRKTAIPLLGALVRSAYRPCWLNDRGNRASH